MGVPPGSTLRRTAVISARERGRGRQPAKGKERENADITGCRLQPCGCHYCSQAGQGRRTSHHGSLSWADVTPFPRTVRPGQPQLLLRPPGVEVARRVEGAPTPHTGLPLPRLGPSRLLWCRSQPNRPPPLLVTAPPKPTQPSAAPAALSAVATCPPSSRQLPAQPC